MFGHMGLNVAMADLLAADITDHWPRRVLTLERSVDARQDEVWAMFGPLMDQRLPPLVVAKATAGHPAQEPVLFVLLVGEEMTGLANLQVPPICYEPPTASTLVASLVAN